MKKSELIAAIMRNEGEVPPRNDPRVSSIIADIQQLLNSGEQVVLPGFASFSIAQDTRPEELKRRELTTIQGDQGEDAIEKQVETMDTYIPEPLRNADGTPYVYATVNRTDRAGIFAQKQAKQQDLSREELKMSGSEKSASIEKESLPAKTKPIDNSTSTDSSRYKIGIFAHVDSGKPITTKPAIAKMILKFKGSGGKVRDDGYTSTDIVCEGNTKSPFGLIWSHPK